jgi:hypothetical protein
MRLIFLTVTMSLTLLATNADSDPGTQPATASEKAAIKLKSGVNFVVVSKFGRKTDICPKKFAAVDGFSEK